MNTNEFNREFNILYDNIASQGAPGINTYEKSVFLTQAQEELVKAYYSADDDGKGFESNEKLRREMSDLVLPYSSSLTVDNEYGLSPSSKFFVIPNDTWYIVAEDIKITGPSECLVNKIVGVKPITHDEYKYSSRNPFRKPNERRAWRMDVSLGGASRVVEIISGYEVLSYNMRYIRKPQPIILVDLGTDPEYTGLDLTIDGISTKTECNLNSSIHRNILRRAVELATLSYRESSLGNKVELNKRSV